MLKGIPAIISPELLKVLCEMGHGDRIVIADGNFPSESVGKNGIVIRADGHGVPEGDFETCLACVHNCPQKAISIIPTPPEPEEANRNARYRHPNVTIADLIRANSQAAL